MESELDVLFLGGLFPKEMYSEIYEKSINGMQNAANSLQWSIVKGLDKNLGYPIKILNMIFVGSYPKRYKDIIIKSFKFSHSKGASDYNIGYLNLTVIKQLFLNVIAKKHLKKWSNDSKGRRKVLIIYSAQPYFLEAAKYVKKLNKNINVCLIVPDIPKYMSLNTKSNVLFEMYRIYQIQSVNKKVEYIDGFVFLTEYMANYFQVKKPYIIVEGMSSDLSDQDAYLENNEKDAANRDLRIVLYSGTLTRKYGVIDLVESFRKIDREDYRLIICGEGETKEEIIQHSREDDRIIYKGLLPHEDVKKLQSQATILINPRKNNEEYTKFSFPSKIIEYLSSGKPVICYKLDGIPEEYSDYLIYLDDENNETMSRKIVEICDKEEIKLKEIGNKNKKFIMDKKNNLYQTNRILQMIREIDQ